jgi:hypothetical protein
LEVKKISTRTSFKKLSLLETQGGLIQVSNLIISTPEGPALETPGGGYKAS